MDNKKQAADRVRHILQAMERSIDDARRKRVTGIDTPPPSERPAGPPPTSHAAPVVNGQAASVRNDEQLIGGSAPDPDAPVRLKAKPKRPSMIVNKNDDNWQSKAS